MKAERLIAATAADRLPQAPDTKTERKKQNGERRTANGERRTETSRRLRTDTSGRASGREPGSTLHVRGIRE